MIGIVSCSILFLICVLLIIRLFAVKRELRSLTSELDRNRALSYNRQLTVSHIDSDLTALAVQMNRNLDYQKTLKYNAQQSELTLRQSISDIAHDLRTPLTVIRGNLQMLEQDPQITGKSLNRLQTCRGKAVELSEMVDDFFEMSVLESDTEPVPLEPVNLTNLLMQFLVDHEAFIQERSLTPDIRFPGKAPIILANERLLLRILENLLGNVVKYAKDSFVLSVEPTENDQCRISFSNAVDAEHAIPDDTEQLFLRNYRASRARSGKGAGLGLYIVKLLAQKQNADAYARKYDNRLEIGVTFRMTGKSASV